MFIKDKICFFNVDEKDVKKIKKSIEINMYDIYYENILDNILQSNELYNVIISNDNISTKELAKLELFSKKTHTSILILSEFKNNFYYVDISNIEYLVYLIKVLCRVSWVSRINEKNKNKSVQDRHNRTIELIGELDKHTKSHSSQVLDYTTLIGIELGLDKYNMVLLTSAAMLHDIGKAIVPKEILLNPNKLTADEFEIIKLHTIILDNIIEDEFEDVKHIIRHHHEKWNGTGYPDGLKGEEIPLLSRVITVTDSFDAMTSKRIYNTPVDIKRAKEILINDSGTHFDKNIVNIFINILNEKKKNNN